MPQLVVGELVDGKYRVSGLCSDSGGMGTIVHVEPAVDPGFEVVLKYCKLDPNAPEGAEGIRRFQREVRYLIDLNGNARTVNVVDYNLAADPPYFVMKYYPEGDLTTISDHIRQDPAFQETILYKIVDCIQELHARDILHRDIKPENFLRNGDDIVVSDLGLAKIPGAGTTFTLTQAAWGTMGYMPPEYIANGFRNATVEGDIFMLGKTIYSLLTDRDVLYLSPNGLSPAIFHVIQRCCNQLPVARYDSVASLRQDIKLAYDVILNRAGQIDRVRQMATEIQTELDTNNRYESAQVTGLLDAFAMLNPTDRAELLREWPAEFYHVLSDDAFTSRIGTFLDQYETFAQHEVGTWSYAETVARNMRILFDKHANPDVKARALEIAIQGAQSANRFAAMATCNAMINSVTDAELAQRVAGVLTKHAGTFVKDNDPVNAKSDIVRNALRALAGQQ